MASSVEFFSIPQTLRLRIYREAGLTVDASSFIELNRSPKQKTKWHSITHSLFLTCRTIYAEASALVYSTNKFTIRYRDARSLKGLTNLTGSTLRSLTYLAVYLNVTSCETYPSCLTICCSRHRWDISLCLQHDKPLGATSDDVLLDWRDAIRYISDHITPSTLKLDFVCDVEDLNVGHLVVEPLRSLPPLADCSIRLNRGHQQPLQALAIETGSRAMGIWEHVSKQNSSPFRFMDLPREIRLQILEYTDLVTPFREVEWNPKDNFYLHDVCYVCEERGEDPKHQACHFRNCCLLESEDQACFCNRYHTAFSSKCHCWVPPKSLFLVCKAMKEDVQAVFFAKNHFVITPIAGCHYPAENSPDPLEALTFFVDVVPLAAVCFLKSLEIVFPPFHNDYLIYDEPAYGQWLQVIDLMCQLNLPLLSLSVAMAESHKPRAEAEVRCRTTMSKEQAFKIIKMYARTIEPLSKLKENGLRALFLTLASPYCSMEPRRSTPYGLTAHYQFLEKTAQQTLQFTRRIERKIMGENYDSSLIQHKAHGQSGWLAEHRLAWI